VFGRSLIAITSIFLAVFSSADSAPTRRPGHSAPTATMSSTKVLPLPPEPESSDASGESANDCRTVRKNLRALNASGHRVATCYERAQRPSNAGQPKSLLPLDGVGPPLVMPDWCFQHPGDSRWYRLRTQACKSEDRVLNLFDTQTSDLVGQLYFTEDAYVVTDVTGLPWDLQILILMDDVGSWGPVFGSKVQGGGQCHAGASTCFLFGPPDFEPQDVTPTSVPYGIISFDSTATTPGPLERMETRWGISAGSLRILLGTDLRLLPPTRLQWSAATMPCLESRYQVA
jgi:hypothetical protein